MNARAQVRVRIAPSPTGYLHVGTARTALFNWLFAKKYKGVFIVRIEDTDRERSKKEYEEDILDSLMWLGITYDEGPFYQSKNTETYKKYLTELLSKKHAYYCFCTKDDLEVERESMLASGIAPKYSGKCRALSLDEVGARQKSGDASVIRFRMPENIITFTDMIRGKIMFDVALLGDIVIAKSTIEPLYNFAVVIDDHKSMISHVIRGEDHIANTPKQIVIQEALDFPRPHYAHLPLILDTQRGKMSKRFSATAIKEYRLQGYRASAMVNFLALLGWHPSHDKEIFSTDELIEEFDISRVQKKGAVFSLEKLDWINNQYIKQISDTDLVKEIQKSSSIPKKFTEDRLTQLIHVVRDRIKKLNDFHDVAAFFFKLPEYVAEMLIWKKSSRIDTLENLKRSSELLFRLDDRSFTQEALSKAFQPLIEAHGRGEVLWPVRVALSGSRTSPGPYEIMSVLGKDESLTRIKTAISKLS